MIRLNTIIMLPLSLVNTVRRRRLYQSGESISIRVFSEAFPKTYLTFCSFTIHIYGASVFTVGIIVWETQDVGTTPAQRLPMFSRRRANVLCFWRGVVNKYTSREQSVSRTRDYVVKAPREMYGVIKQGAVIFLSRRRHALLTVVPLLNVAPRWYDVVLTLCRAAWLSDRKARRACLCPLGTKRNQKKNLRRL